MGGGVRGVVKNDDLRRLLADILGFSRTSDPNFWFLDPQLNIKYSEIVKTCGTKGNLNLVPHTC